MTCTKTLPQSRGGTAPSVFVRGGDDRSQQSKTSIYQAML
ncbi:hypothetical protein SALB1_2247 [Salinisphaera sp. LB1]|nr:hypothetical protein SALB1_2247 [Salinisphaera sp. LB1]